jgi:hypothetical protein
VLVAVLVHNAVVCHYVDPDVRFDEDALVLAAILAIASALAVTAVHARPATDRSAWPAE